MKIGFGAPVSGAWATPDNLTSFASRAERAGYDSLWTFQRLLIPAGSAMDPVYQSVLDPIVSLGYAAAGTSRIRLGTAIVNLPFISPAVLAKQAATLDILSGGRLDLGLGSGWMPEEFQATGASMARRGARTEEYVAVLHALWASGVTEFSGEFYSVPAGRADPKPVQPGGPPILLGGGAPAALARAGRIADGWLTASRTDLARIADGVEVVKSAARDAGRDPDAVRIICRG
ncbi:MAG TPA: TIGR03619 family F420-dependent LLM class oxidoreductase, partial [Streptosporangiaceae bacterium]